MRNRCGPTSDTGPQAARVASLPATHAAAAVTPLAIPPRQRTTTTTAAVCALAPRIAQPTCAQHGVTQGGRRGGSPQHGHDGAPAVVCSGDVGARQHQRARQVHAAGRHCQV